MRIFFLGLLIMGLTSCESLLKRKESKNPDDSQRPFLGIEFEIVPTLFKKSIDGYDKGLRLEFVFPNSPGFKAGLHTNDILVAIDGKKLYEYDIRNAEQFTNWLAIKKPKDHLLLTVLRKEKTEQISVVLERRKYSFGEAYEQIPEVDLKNFKDNHSVPDFEKIITEEKIETETQALRERFALMTEAGDKLRMPAVVDLQKNPFKLHKMSHWIWDKMADRQMEPLARINQIIHKVNAESPSSYSASKVSPLFQLVEAVKKSQTELQKSFDEMSISRKEKLIQSAPLVAQQLAEMIYIHKDTNKERRDKNIALIEDLQKIKPTHWLQAFNPLAQKMTKKLLSDIKVEAKKLIGDKKSVKIPTTLGFIRIYGTSDDIHERIAEEQTFLVIDLGGNDRYLNIDSSIIDYDGNDQYRSSESWREASNIGDVSFIIDLEGNDHYLANSGNFASTLFGISFLWDLQGQDDYRCLKYCFGVALGGVAAFIDESGNDRYESLQLSQAVGIAGGYGVLMDLQGNDSYYSQGAAESGYGDAGNFEGWSQGVGLGLRGLISGGLGLLYDGQGEDHFESGDWSQGGGYYFGYGLLINDGKENDTYSASRYAQGFTAHYAIGSFIEAGGNDTYNMHHIVGQGMSWDLAITSFEDFAGNDTYTTCPNCLGSAAQSGITFFTDYQGDDYYRGSDLPYGPNISNEYHTGISLGFFIDQGHGNDHYEKFKNNSKVLRPKYQWYIDQ